MSFERIRQRFHHIPFGMKLVGVGSLALAVSTFLPWYSDIDQTKYGDMFLGVTGPASFVGIVIFLLALSVFGLFGAHLLERRRPRLPVDESTYYLFVGLESLFLLLLVVSIYFHPKFGVNLIKDPRFGLIIGFLASIVLSYGGYHEYKKEKTTEDAIGKLEPLVTMAEKKPMREAVPLAETTRAEAEQDKPKLSPLKERLPRGFSFGELAAGQEDRPFDKAQDRPHISLPKMKSEELRERHEQPLSGKESPVTPPVEGIESGGSYKIRMDL